MQNPIQVVFVKWGTRYSCPYVNNLVAQIKAHCSADIRFICFTEIAEGLDPDIDARPFPPLAFPLKELIARRGSLPKHAIFRRGELEEGVPAIYLDLDTAIFGDVARLADCLTRRRGLYLLTRHAVPTWRIRRLVFAIRPDRYYLGNTAVMAWYPEDFYDIYDRYMAEYPVFVDAPDTLDALTRSLYTEGNERIISHTARHQTRVFPRAVATKFTQEYMAPFLALARLKDHLPWVRARRKRQPVITFHGAMLKPEFLARTKTGDIVRHKFHKTRWNYDRITRYWQQALSADG